MRTRIHQNKEQIYCLCRKRWVRLTPEEWVRQQLLHQLVNQLGYPASHIAVEVSLPIPAAQEAKKKHRADILIYDAHLQPLVLVECKAETVSITQKTLDQALTYNRKLNVPFLILYNGPQTVFVHVPSQSASSSIPHYSTLTTEN